MQYQTKMPPPHRQKEYAKLCEIHSILDRANKTLGFSSNHGYKLVPIKFLKTYKLYKDNGDELKLLLDDMPLDEMLDLIRTAFPI